MTVAVVSLAALALLLGVVGGLLIREVLRLGDAVDSSRVALHTAEAERDDALTRGAKAAGDLVESQRALRAAQADNEKLRLAALSAEERNVDAKSGDDLVSVSRGVFGDVPDAGDSGSASGPAGSSTVPSA